MLDIHLLISQNFACRIVPGNARHAAAGVGSRTALIEPFDRRAVVAIAEHRSRTEQLVQRECAVKNIATDQTKFTLQIER